MLLDIGIHVTRIFYFSIFGIFFFVIRCAFSSLYISLLWLYTQGSHRWKYSILLLKCVSLEVILLNPSHPCKAGLVERVIYFSFVWDCLECCFDFLNIFKMLSFFLFFYYALNVKCKCKYYYFCYLLQIVLAEKLGNCARNRIKIEVFLAIFKWIKNVKYINISL